MTRWAHLPLEIQLIVLEMLARDPSDSNTGSRKAHLASYATVSKEWQSLFERRNFYKLTLDSSCLDDFENIVRRQRGLIKYIWLRIRLRTYGCPDCKKLEGQRESARNHAIVSKAIWKLFTILSTWERNADQNDEGMTLEISAHSTSDFQHAFKDHYFETDAYPESIDEYESSEFHDPSHGWDNGRRFAKPGIECIYRILGRERMLPTFHVGHIPDVNFVTSFLVRRQTRRQFRAEAVFQILNSLPRLEHINYEPWRDLSKSFQRNIDWGMFL